MKHLVPVFNCSLHLSEWTDPRDGANADPLGVECYPLESEPDAFPTAGPDPFLCILGQTGDAREQLKEWAVTMLAQTLVEEDAVDPDYTNFNDLTDQLVRKLNGHPWAEASIVVDGEPLPGTALQHPSGRWAVAWQADGASRVAFAVDVPREAVALRTPTDTELADLQESLAELAACDAEPDS